MTVKVALTVEPVEAVDLYLRSFDVDDPTDDQAPVDDEGADEDNRGTSPARRGMLDGADASGAASLTFDGASEAEIDFQVAMQPGDNFRIVANGDRDFLLDLHNDDAMLGASNADKQRIVNSHVLNAPGPPPSQSPTPADAEMRQPGKYASEVLTVWRFLHLEVDSMGPVSGNYVEAHITGLDTGASLTATEATLDVSLDDGSPDLEPSEGEAIGNGRFENGELRVAGAHTIAALEGNGNQSVKRGAGLNVCAQPLPITIEAPGNPPSQLEGTVTQIDAPGVILTITHPDGASLTDLVGGQARIAGGDAMMILGADDNSGMIVVDGLRIPCTLYDDDIMRYPEGAEIPQPDISGMAEVWRKAYIAPIEHPEFATPDAPFSPYTNRHDELQDIFPTKNIPLSQPRYWGATVLNAFQALNSREPFPEDDEFDNDMDPDSEGNVEGTYRGTAILLVGGVFIAVESLGDWIQWPGGGNGIDPDTVNPPRQSHYQEILNHEVGHLFGLDHDDGESMAQEPFGGVMAATDAPRRSSEFTRRSLDKIRASEVPRSQ